jgi:MULE transposase domain
MACFQLGTYLIKLGVPVAWMLMSNGTKETISFFLCWVQDGSPQVSPAVMMTDCDLAQIHMLENVYPDSQIFLCKWHVLHTMQSHFNIHEFLELWIKVRDLVNTPDKAVFNRLLAEISSNPLSPQTFVDYMKSQWIPNKEMWSKAYRQGLSIFEEGNTNMLIEA